MDKLRVGLFFRITIFATDDSLDKIARSCADVIVNSTNILAKQSHAYQLEAGDEEQYREQGEYTLSSPCFSQNKPEHDNQQAEKNSQERHDSTYNTQKPERESSHAG